jgi:hypothetical protein
MREVPPWRLGWNVNVIVAWGTIINPVEKWLGNGWEMVGNLGIHITSLHCISFDLIISCIPGARHDRSKDPLTCDPWDSSRLQAEWVESAISVPLGPKHPLPNRRSNLITADSGRTTEAWNPMESTICLVRKVVC